MPIDRHAPGVAENVRHDLDILIDTSFDVHLKAAEHDGDEAGQNLSTSTQHVCQKDQNSRAGTGAPNHVEVVAWQWVTNTLQDLLQYE